MATVSKEIAESEIEKLKKQTRPKVYCVVLYRNIIFDKDDYAICYRPYHYDELSQSPAVGEVEVLWKSPRFERDHPPTEDVEDFEDWLMSDEAQKLIAGT